MFFFVITGSFVGGVDGNVRNRHVAFLPRDALVEDLTPLTFVAVNAGYLAGVIVIGKATGAAAIEILCFKEYPGAGRSRRVQHDAEVRYRELGGFFNVPQGPYDFRVA